MIEKSCMKGGKCTTKEQEDFSSFLLCFDFEHGAKSSFFPECAKSNGFGDIAQDILTCSQGAEGIKLRAFDVDHDKPSTCEGAQCPRWFPYILVNGKEVTAQNPDDIDHFGETWEKYICTAYTGATPPAACKKWQ
jgi:hypothetical protein